MQTLSKSSEGEESSSGRTCVIALGNDILGDDAVGLIAARRLKGHFSDIEFIEAVGEGFELLDRIARCDRLLLLDSIITGERQPGTVVQLSREHFARLGIGSPHRAGLPEILAVAEQLSIKLPSQLSILAMEVENPFDFREILSPAVENALPEFVQKASEILNQWRQPS